MVLDGHDPAAIRQAAQTLAAGDLLGLPTETVYGLAADAASDSAVAKIFTAKGRPSDHPLIVHLAPGGGGVAHFAAQVPAFAQALMDAFWPGPLTLILPRRPGVGAAAAGGQDSIGLRCPAHPVAQAVLQACAALGVAGLAAPSANQFGRVSPTTAAHVLSEFGDGLLVLDGGPCSMGIESTIVDCSRGVPVLLRPGSIGRDQIEAACGQPLRDKDDVAALQAAPRASGTLEAHYAPTAKVRLMTATALQAALDLLGQVPAGADGQAASIGVYHRTPLQSRAPQLLLRRMPTDAAAAAQQLFAALRDFDTQGVR
ncbi:MAG: hypothetical protein RLZZ401_103, partial [Pseudomonadota bacterium]